MAYLPFRNLELLEIDLFFTRRTSLLFTNDNPAANAEIMKTVTTWESVLKSYFKYGEKVV